MRRLAEYGAGVIERSRVTPASRAALLLGRVLRDVVGVAIGTRTFRRESA